MEAYRCYGNPCATCATCAISCGRKNFVWLGRLKLNERSGEAAEAWDELEFTIDTKVREFAEHLGCDPRVAQEAYDRMKVDWSLDGGIGRELREELRELEAVERSINRANYFMRLIPQERGLLQLTSQLEGREIRKEIASLQAELSELVALGHAKLSEEVGAKGVNRRADLIAEYVADLFRTLDRPIGFGRNPIDASEPSTPFGRAVRDALIIFRVYAAPTKPGTTPEFASWRQPAQKASQKANRKPNTP
jgi:hypothetical protein